MSIAEDIRLRCREKGADAALAFGKAGPDTLSYGQLGHYMESAAARLHRLGIHPGAVCGISIESPIVHIAVLLALEWLGAATATAGTAKELTLLKLDAAFTDGSVPPLKCPVHRIDQSWFGDQAVSPLPPRHEPAPDDVCHIAFTSGSTGEPRPVAVTRRMLSERKASQWAALGEVFARATSRLGLVGINAMAGYRPMMHTLAEGGLFCLGDLNMGRCVNRMRMYKVQVVLGAPLRLADLANYGETHPGSFPTVEIVVPIGAKSSPVLVERLRRFVCPNVVISYGSTERGIIASGPADRIDIESGEVGFLRPGAQVEIVDDNDQPVSDFGRVRIASDLGPFGYYGQNGESENFKGKWFYPGDVGMITKDRRLFIAGRQDNLVNLGGVKTTLEAVEIRLAAAPAVKEIAVVAKPDESGLLRLTAFVVAGEGWSEPKFWEFCRAIRNDAFRPGRLVMMPSLPRLSGGKLDRRLLASAN